MQGERSPYSSVTATKSTIAFTLMMPVSSAKVCIPPLDVGHSQLGACIGPGDSQCEARCNLTPSFTASEVLSIV